MFKKTEEIILLPFVVVFLSYVLSYIYTAISGAYHLPFWSFGILIFLFLTTIFFMFRKKFKGLLTFLILIFFSIWIYPTSTYLLYQNNSNNYDISDSFIENEILLINEKAQTKIPLSELKRIREYLKKENVEESPKFIEIPERYNFKYLIVGLSGRVLLTISKNDSIETELSYLGRPPRPTGRIEDSENQKHRNVLILGALNREISGLEKSLNFSPTKIEKLPYSEFWTESIIAFSSGDIKPARNMVKILNSIQIISALFISTILLNTVNNNLSVKRRKKKKKKKKKKTKK